LGFDASFFLLPSAEEKRRYWEFARGRFGTVVIIDDLSRGHESGAIVTYSDLVSAAGADGAVYVGLDEINRLIEGGELSPAVA
ncbi:hypothetical protein ABTM96_20350, partial [Acinetobacter baumannii]